jgi:preprotein translocase subunit SecD
MSRSACFLAAVFSLAGQATVWAQDKAPGPGQRPPGGVYAVRREGAREQEVLPLKDGEALVVNRHRYLKNGENEPPRFLVVRRAPDVALDLAGPPKAVEEGGEVVRILLKLRPQAAGALERLTRDHLGRQVAIVLGGEVVTVHKVREVIKGGDVQITSCAAGAAPYLLKQLRDHHRDHHRDR